MFNEKKKEKEYKIILQYKYYNKERTLRFDSKGEMQKVFTLLSKGLSDKSVMLLDVNSVMDWNEAIDMTAIASVYCECDEEE